MELPKSGVRGFFEIFMPGGFFLVNILMTLCLVRAVSIGPTPSSTLTDVVPTNPCAPARDGLPLPASKGPEDPCRDCFLLLGASPAYSVLLILAFGYLIGVVLRMMKVSFVDKWSARFILFCHKWLGWIPLFAEDPKWAVGVFFYDQWSLEKASRISPDFEDYYRTYWSPKCRGDSRENIAVFEFCKLILNKHDVASAREVYAAEALSRFAAGSFYALVGAIVLAVLDFAALSFGQHCPRSLVWFFVALTVVYLVLLLVILREFRPLRCKEVDTVITACYANRKLFEGLLPLTKDHQYARRQALIGEAWRRSRAKLPDRPALAMADLLHAMREESETAPYLSSLYFAGADVDHPYFLKNDVLAIGLAVLPEDAEKSAKQKRHPHQVEVLFVVEGAIRVHVEEGGEVSEMVVSAGEHFVIDKGQCHWITLEAQNAAFVFVKTNCAKEPRSEDCGPGAGSATMT